MRFFSSLFAAGFAAACCSGAFAESPAVPDTEKVATAALAHRERLDYADGSFSGPGWDRLVAEGEAAQFFLLGEEHGIAENPKLAAALFSKLIGAGYSKLVIEVSPPMAAAVDRSARDGIEGLRRQFAEAGGEPAFFGMKEEAEMLAAVRAAAKPKSDVFWGVDYEVGGDRLLIRKLEAKKKPKAAAEALARLKEASDASWAEYEKTRNPQFIYSFTGDPALVRALREAWPKHDRETTEILATLEETFEINRHWIKGEGWASNERRSRFIRNNFLARWREQTDRGRAPKVFVKMGASHVIRGRSQSEVYDIGTLAPELAALESGKAFHLLVLPGEGSNIARFNPVKWIYEPANAKDGYGDGLPPITSAAFADAFTLIDLRPMRSILNRQREGTDPELMRIVHGFDMVLVMSGSTPSSNLRD